MPYILLPSYFECIEFNKNVEMVFLNYASQSDKAFHIVMTYMLATIYMFMNHIWLTTSVWIIHNINILF